jgi:hypothetical protein
MGLILLSLYIVQPSPPLPILHSTRELPHVLLQDARPHGFEVFSTNTSGEQEPHFRFIKRMEVLIKAEEAVVATSELAMADHLARVLMLTHGCRL